jgi:hypothetical protein
VFIIILKTIAALNWNFFLSSPTSRTNSWSTRLELLQKQQFLVLMQFQTIKIPSFFCPNPIDSWHLVVGIPQYKKLV